MGQRLNIEITKDGESLANGYYHWSAYTGSALDELEPLVEQYNALAKAIPDPKLRAIRLLETTGAGFPEDEMAEVQKCYPGKWFQPAVNRNTGLIAITEKGMNETRDIEEGCIEVNLSDDTIDFTVYGLFEKNDYKENNEDYDELKTDPDAARLTDIFPIHNFAAIRSAVKNCFDRGDYTIKNAYGDVICFDA